MPKSKRDYYEILSVGKNANVEEIKKAYRKCALAHHPDRNQGDKESEEKFREATEAYQILSDPKKRQVYDQYGHEGLSAQGMGAGGFSASSDFSDIFEGIFEDFFGGRRTGRQTVKRGSDLLYELRISFEESAFGIAKDLEIKRHEVCDTCHGKGAKPGTSQKRCSECHGSGQILASSGFFSVARTCNHCHGEGVFTEHPCLDCHGDGRVASHRKIHVKIPAGIDHGSRLRISGEGEAGSKGGPHGDLYVDIFVAAHEFFAREGNDVVFELPVSLVQVALGCEIEVPTLKGPQTLKIPASTQTGKILKLKGFGFPALRGKSVGDECVKILVETPAHLSDKQKSLLKEFGELSGEKAHPISNSFMERVKKIFSKEKK